MLVDRKEEVPQRNYGTLSSTRVEEGSVDNTDQAGLVDQAVEPAVEESAE